MALSTIFDTDECPRAGAVLDQVELIPLTRLSLLADCHREDEKARASRPRPASSRNMADCTSSAAVSECSRGFEVEIRSSTTDHDDSGGGWSLSVGAMRHESLPLSASVPGRVRFAKPRQLRGARLACVDDTPNRRQHRSSAEVDIWDSVSCLGRIYSKSPSVFGAVNLEHPGRPTLAQRTGA